MKELRGIAKFDSESGRIVRIDQRYEWGVCEFIDAAMYGEPLKHKAAGAKRASTVSECWYITNAHTCIPEIIAYLKTKLRDVTEDGKQNLAKGEFSYIVTAAPDWHWYCIKLVTVKGKKVVLYNTDNIVRNAADTPDPTVVDIIHEIWARYSSPAMTLTGIAEEEYNAYLMAANCKSYFKDENAAVISKTGQTINDFCRPAYFGGWNFCNAEEYKCGTGIRLDVHSLYPSVMADRIPADMIYTYCDSEWQWQSMTVIPDMTYFIHFKCSFDAKPGVFPFISCRDMSIGTKSVNMATSSVTYDKKTYKRKIEMTMAAPEYEAFRDLYNVKNFEFIDAVYFKLVDVAAPYIREKYKAKQAAKGQGAKYIVEKVLLNSITGGFGRKPEVINEYYDEDMRPHSLITKIDKPSHVAIGAYITACGRARMARLAYKYKDRFLYCDTDSLHLEGVDVPEDIAVSEKIGDFALETTFSNAYYWGKKKYVEWNQTEAQATFAGLPIKYAKLFADAMLISSSPDIITRMKVLSKWKAGMPLFNVYTIMCHKIIGDIKEISQNPKYYNDVIEIPYVREGEHRWRLYSPSYDVKKHSYQEEVLRAASIMENACTEEWQRQNENMSETA